MVLFHSWGSTLTYQCLFAYFKLQADIGTWSCIKEGRQEEGSSSGVNMVSECSVLVSDFPKSLSTMASFHLPHHWMGLSLLAHWRTGREVTTQDHTAETSRSQTANPAASLHDGRTITCKLCHKRNSLLACPQTLPTACWLQTEVKTNHACVCVIGQ